MVIWNGDACDIRPKSGSMIWFQNNKKNMQEKESQISNNSQDYKQINNKKIHVLLCHGTTKTHILLDKWALYYC